MSATPRSLDSLPHLIIYEIVCYLDCDEGNRESLCNFSLCSSIIRAVALGAIFHDLYLYFPDYEGINLKLHEIEAYGKEFIKFLESNKEIAPCLRVIDFNTIENMLPYGKITDTKFSLIDIMHNLPNLRELYWPGNCIVTNRIIEAVESHPSLERIMLPSSDALEDIDLRTTSKSFVSKLSVERFDGLDEALLELSGLSIDLLNLDDMDLGFAEEQVTIAEALTSESTPFGTIQEVIVPAEIFEHFQAVSPKWIIQHPNLTKIHISKVNEADGWENIIKSTTPELLTILTSLDNISPPPHNLVAFTQVSIERSENSMVEDDEGINRERVGAWVVHDLVMTSPAWTAAVVKSLADVAPGLPSLAFGGLCAIPHGGWTEESRRAESSQYLTQIRRFKSLERVMLPSTMLIPKVVNIDAEKESYSVVSEACLAFAKEFPNLSSMGVSFFNPEDSVNIILVTFDRDEDGNTVIASTRHIGGEVDLELPP